MADDRCAMCGRRVALHDRHIRFLLPAPILDLPERDRTSGVWMSHATAAESVMMQADGVGAFVRALLPVQLDGGYRVTYGVWISVHPAQLQEAFAVWWEPAYKDLRLDGRLANVVKPWGLLAAPVVAMVRSMDETPYCTESPDPVMTRVLGHEWPHGQMLDAYSDTD